MSITSINYILIGDLTSKEIIIRHLFNESSKEDEKNSDKIFERVAQSEEIKENERHKITLNPETNYFFIVLYSYFYFISVSATFLEESAFRIIDSINSERDIFCLSEEERKKKIIQLIDKKRNEEIEIENEEIALGGNDLTEHSIQLKQEKEKKNKCIRNTKIIVISVFIALVLAVSVIVPLVLMKYSPRK